MGSLAEVQNNLVFLNTGQNQKPGVIVMKLDANGGNYGYYKHILVVFNATNAQEVFTDARLKGLSLKLSPVQKNSSDPVAKESTFDSQEGAATVPAPHHCSLCSQLAVRDYARPAKSRVSVATFTFSPSLINSGTRISRPVSSRAGLVPLPLEESPRAEGSV